MSATLGRRAFLGAATVVAGAVGAAALSRTMLSLSVRVAEAFRSKETSTMTLDALIALARTRGYAALCMRASQAGVQTPLETVRAMRRALDAAGLRVSMVTGDVAVPANDERGPECLRRIGPYLDLAEAFGADLIRVCMKADDDIPWAQRAADEASERRIRLAHQSHCASLFETVEGSRRLAGRIFNVYVQNHRLVPGGAASVETWKRGTVRLEHIGLWEPGGVDFDEVFDGLRAIGYGGYVTVHQAFAGVMPVEEAAHRCAEFLRARIG